ncbi:MAG: hypothetical protein J6S81_09065, partial [Treponema sp.]|nr:hypothetical protein [Treponema sp.]
MENNNRSGAATIIIISCATVLALAAAYLVYYKKTSDSKKAPGGQQGAVTVRTMTTQVQTLHDYVNTNGEITGYYPEQTVNYVSCHDNWTVRDQLFNTMPKSADGTRPATLESILRASLQAHALVMAGNSAAFILGGEELLRTKEYKGINPDDYPGITKDSYTEMWGHKIS